MRGLVLGCLVSVAGSGCTDLCAGDVCASVNEIRALPGPCTSHYYVENDLGNANIIDATYSYDAAGRITHVESVFDGWAGSMGNSPFHRVDTSDWTYDDAGNVAGITGTEGTWTFDATTATMTVPDVETAIFDRATLTFAPVVGREKLLMPQGLLGLKQRGDTTYTWTRENNVLTRLGSDGLAAYYELDEHGHVTSSRTVISETGAAYVETWTFAADHLVRHVVLDAGGSGSDLEDAQYRYDPGGNLILLRWYSQPEVYRYDCW